MLKRFAAGAVASCVLFPAAATEIGVAAFNLAWAGTQADFDKHIEVCSTPTVNWCDSQARPIGKATPEEQERAKLCQAAFTAAAGGAEQALQVAPCNAYKLSAKKWKAGPATMYQQKLDGLKGAIDDLVAHHKVTVIAFQEVKSEETIKQILGAHASSFDACVAPHNSFQTVGFAWTKSLGPGDCRPRDALAVQENITDAKSLKKVRPGVELALTVNGQQITFLNVHLKSGCANLRDGGGFKGNLLTSEEAACKVLNRQVVPLENWIEDVAARSPLFVVLGDFNRKLHEEKRAKVANNQVREDGTLPDKPNKTDANGSVTTKYLWQEISDGDPSLMQVPPLEAEETTSQQGKSAKCTGLEGLDHILLSSDLWKLQKNPTSVKVPLAAVDGQVIKTSDHCPRVTKISF
jgi:exonuclease III